MQRPDEAMEIAETGCNSDVEILLAAWILAVQICKELGMLPKEEGKS